MAANGKAADDGRVTDLANTVDDRLEEARGFGTLRKLNAGDWFAPASDNADYQSMGTNASVIYTVPLWVPHAVTLDRISVEVVSGGADAYVKLGMYANDAVTDRPGALISDYGMASAATNGHKEITISEPLARGLYWPSVWAFTGAAAISLRSTKAANAVMPLTSSSTRSNVGYYKLISSGSWPTLPASLGSPDINQWGAFIKVRVS